LVKKKFAIYQKKNSFSAPFDKLDLKIEAKKIDSSDILTQSFYISYTKVYQLKNMFVVTVYFKNKGGVIYLLKKKGQVFEIVNEKGFT
jgi:hypothetical protein